MPRKNPNGKKGNDALNDWQKQQKAAQEQAAAVQKLRDAHSKDILRPLPAEHADPLASLNTLGLKLFKAYSATAKGNGLMFPSSIHPVMVMLQAGAKGNTAKQISQAFGIKSSKAFKDGYADLLAAMRGNKDFTLDVHNHIWTKTGAKLLAAYVKVLKQYETGFAELDFSNANHAAKVINDWADVSTKGLIKQIVNPGLFGNDTFSVLGNAVYFKGQWIKPFDEQETYPLPFTPDGGKQVQVPTMTLRKEPVRAFRIKGFTGIDLPMKGASVLLLKPDDGLTLDKAIAGLPADAFEQIDKELQSATVSSLDLYVPKFKIETDTYSLIEACNKCGVTDLFVRGAADLSGMTKAAQLFVSALLHKAVMEVDEKGAVGAAVTVAVVSVTSVAWPPKEFRLDRSFLAIVRDRSKAPVAIAKVHDPLSK